MQSFSRSETGVVCMCVSGTGSRDAVVHLFTAFAHDRQLLRS